MDEKYVARFWSYVDRKGPDDCWEWRGFRDREGYGRFAKHRGNGSVWTESRLAWELGNGRSPGKSFVLHKCDNPPCVNPAHLFLGGHQENSDDMIAKGRLNDRRGSRNSFAKLTEADVPVIRRLVAAGTPRKTVARDYNVCVGAIHHVCTGRTWGHVR